MEYKKCDNDIERVHFLFMYFSGCLVFEVEMVQESFLKK